MGLFHSAQCPPGPTTLQPVRIPLLFKAESYPTVRHTTRGHPSPVPGHPGCVRLLAVLSHAAVSMTTPTPLRPAFSSFLCTPRGSAAGVAWSLFSCWRGAVPSPRRPQPLTFSPARRGAAFSTSWPVFSLFFYNSHPNGHKVVSPCGFDLCFLK